MQLQRLLLFLLLPVLNLQGQIYVDSTATGSNNGTSWSNAYTSLYDALDNVPSFGANVLVAEGAYYQVGANSFAVSANTFLFGGYPAGGGGSSTRNPFVNRTIISGDVDQDDIAASPGNATEFVGLPTLTLFPILVAFENAGSNCGIDGFELRNAPTAIATNGSFPKVNQCFILNNRAGARGTARYINCQFSGNSDSGLTTSLASTQVLNCTFHGNRRSILLEPAQNSYTLTCENSIFWKNYPLDPITGVAVSGPGLVQGTGTGIFNMQGQFNLINCLSQGDQDSFGNLLDPRFLEELTNAEVPSDLGLLRLAPNSDCIDAGVNNTDAGGSDLADNPRLRGASIDQGCFETGGTVYVDASVATSGNGSSWANAYQTLETALISTASGQQILVAQGTYLPDEITAKRSDTFTLDGVLLYGGFPSGGDVFKNRDPKTNKTFLSGDLLQNGDTNINDDSHHVVTVPADAFAAIDGFLVLLGNTEGASDKKGGGIYAPEGGHLFLNDTSVLQNTSTSIAGGIYLNNGTATFKESVIEQNHSSSNGGGIYLDDSTLYLDQSTVSDNTATTNGGGIYSASSGTYHSKTIFDDNAAFRGGGL